MMCDVIVFYVLFSCVLYFLDMNLTTWPYTCFFNSQDLWWFMNILSFNIIHMFFNHSLRTSPLRCLTPSSSLDPSHKVKDQLNATPFRAKIRCGGAERNTRATHRHAPNQSTLQTWEDLVATFTRLWPQAPAASWGGSRWRDVNNPQVQDCTISCYIYLEFNLYAIIGSQSVNSCWSKLQPFASFFAQARAEIRGSGIDSEIQKFIAFKRFSKVSDWSIARIKHGCGCNVQLAVSQ